MQFDRAHLLVGDEVQMKESKALELAPGQVWEALYVGKHPASKRTIAAVDHMTVVWSDARGKARKMPRAAFEQWVRDRRAKLKANAAPVDSVDAQIGEDEATKAGEWATARVDRAEELPAREVTIAEAARRLGVSPQTVRNRIGAGRIRARQPGGFFSTWLVDVSSLK